MAEQEETISTTEAAAEIGLALRRAALIYHHFAQTLIEELGRERGAELIRKAIESYGARIGQEARQKALDKGLEPKPEHFQSDLPKYAWQEESVTVDGEKRTRIHLCPLASEWLDLGDAETGRLYCLVDQAKMRAFNSEYEYVHVRNVLDGDPYCELVVRPVAQDKASPEA